jgi:hypothetical protein
MNNKTIGLTISEQNEIDKEVSEQLAVEAFRLRSLAEADRMVVKVADEIKAVLAKYGASLTTWNDNLYIVPPGFHLYSRYSMPAGVEYYHPSVGLTCPRYDCDHAIVKPFPDNILGKKRD